MDASQLQKSVQISSAQTMGIYALTPAQANKYAGGRRFFLSSNVLSDYWLEHHGDDEILSDIKKYMYEGFFETYKEALMYAELVKANSIIRILNERIKSLETCNFDWESEGMND